MDEIYIRVKKGACKEQIWTSYSRRRGKIVAFVVWGSDLYFIARDKSETHIVELINSSIRDNLTRFNKKSKRFSKCYNTLKDTLLLFFQRKQFCISIK